MSHDSSSKAIAYAFIANLVIAISKTGAAIWTGSGSLMAEAIHSFADCGNQVLLFVGMKRSSRVANAKHPMGFGRESYIWSMMVAITLFSVGGLFSVYEGWERFHHPQALENAEIALGILFIAIIMESFSLRGALNELRAERGERSLWRWFRDTHSSELMVVVGEDIAALLGLVLAMVMLGLAVWTGNPVYDAIGSGLIGVLLIVVAILVGHEVHGLLLGESNTAIHDAVQSYLLGQDGVKQVLNIWAIHHGSAVMIAIKAELNPDWTVAQAVTTINNFEQQIKIDHPSVQWVFFEIDNVD